MTWALEAELGTWDPAARVAPFLLGVVLLVIAGMSIVRTMVIPRMSVSWLFAVIVRGTDVLFAGFARLTRTYAARDRILAWSGPVGIIAALVVWLLFFLAAALCWAIFGLLMRRWQVKPQFGILGIACFSALAYLPVYLLWLPKQLDAVPMSTLVLQGLYQFRQKPGLSDVA